MRLYELATPETEDRFGELLRASTQSSIVGKPQLYMSRIGGGGGMFDRPSSYPQPSEKHKFFPKPGDRKPEDGFWTSTAWETKHGWESAWSQWVKNRMVDWFSDKGTLFYPKAGAKILIINNDKDFREIYDLYVDLTHAKHPDIENDMGAMKIFKHFPWPWVAQHWDAVHTENPSRSGLFMGSWDVESTVWFNMNALGKIGDVKINPMDV